MIHLIFIGAIISIGLALTLRWTGITSLVPLLRPSSITHVSFPSTSLQGARFWTVFIYIIAASISRRLSISGRRSPWRITENDASEATYRLDGPTVSLSMPFRIRRGDIDKYARAVTANQATITHEEILRPPHLHLLLSALTEPAMLLLLSTRTCPIDPVGTVNVRNRFELTRPLACAQRLKDCLRNAGDGGGDLSIIARLDQDVKKVKRGWEYRVIVDLLDEKGEDPVLYRQIFTILQFHKHSCSTSIFETEVSDTPKSLLEVGKLHLTANDPKSWASFSKDYNPIHLSTLAAKLFGFSSIIAHGNHVAAKAVHHFSLSDRLEDDKQQEESWMEVEFKRPTFLPCELKIQRVDGQSSSVVQLQIGKGDKINLSMKFAH
ncbi:hypothetical protein IAR55_005188 [Kwoniella newhampshirensis]|uniref:MaoC-like domain-containing protein n=1 Tax=Kwoniella newhampshirensis TaxID=1651941 RepID=A0AAW0YK80_9TREE